MATFAKGAVRTAFNAVGYDVVKVSRISDASSTAIRRFQLPKDELYQKVFGVGFNKTGTTSLSEIFKHLGFSVPRESAQERMLSDDVLHTEYGGLKEFVSQYDAFQDMPFSQGLTFVACDSLFPNSKFILTVRDDDEWFRSLFAQYKRVFKFSNKSELDKSFFKNKAFYLYDDYVYNMVKTHVISIRKLKTVEDWSLLFDKEHYKAFYNARNEQVIRYFQNRPDKLLVIDLAEERDTKRICDFLSFPKNYITKMPHKNKG